MAKYINAQTGREISESTYNRLQTKDKRRYVRKDEDDSGDFLTSAVIGAVTDSALLGGMLGGDMLGGIVGDLFDGDLFD